MVLKYLFFGQFLLKKGLITFDDIFKARMLQKKQNLRIGDLALKRGWLTQTEIDKVLVLQEETAEEFGEIAICTGLSYQRPGRGIAQPPERRTSLLRRSPWYNSALSQKHS